MDNCRNDLKPRDEKENNKYKGIRTPLCQECGYRFA